MGDPGLKEENLAGRIDPEKKKQGGKKFDEVGEKPSWAKKG